MNKKAEANIQNKDQFSAVYLKTRKQIFIDNLIGGIAWGLGSIIGATVIIGIAGIIIVNTKKVPLVGPIVNIIQEQIRTGANDITNLGKK